MAINIIELESEVEVLIESIKYDLCKEELSPLLLDYILNKINPLIKEGKKVSTS